jgi:hypothetical protein
MELRHLRYFVAVGEEQHYGRAARRLRVAQPALSRQIHDLEEELGFKLFDRLPRGVKLSAAGKLFLEDARRILQETKRPTAPPEWLEAKRWYDSPGYVAVRQHRMRGAKYLGLLVDGGVTESIDERMPQSRRKS